MTEPIGHGYKDHEIQANAVARLRDQKEHTHVYWLCRKCGRTERTAVDTINMLCACFYWMQWSYRPFACEAA